MATYIASPNIAVAPAVAQTVRIAAFGCEGVEDLSRELGFPVAVVAAVESVDAHARRLQDLWYASGTPKAWEEWCLPFDFHTWPYREWSQVPIDVRWFGHTPHPLRSAVDDGTLLLHLPIGVTPASYALAFKDGLANLRFETVARRPSALVRRHHARKNVAVTSRYARASINDQTAVEVRDLVSFGSRTLTEVADVALRTLVQMGTAARVD